MLRFFVFLMAVVLPGLSLAQEGTAPPPDPLHNTQLFIPHAKRTMEDPPGVIYVDTPSPRKKLLSLNFKETPFPQVLRYLSEQTGRKFAAHASLKKVLVTTAVQEQRWTKILETLVFQHDLEVESFDGIIKLSKVESANAGNKTAEMFLLLFKIFLACFVLTATTLVIRMLFGGSSSRKVAARW